VRKAMMQAKIDPSNFDLFFQSSFGQYLLEGIEDEDKVEKQGITRVSQFIKEQNNYQKAMQKAKFDACLQQSRIETTSQLKKKEAKSRETKGPRK